MPTINQLIRKGRNRQRTKSKSPALQFGYNVLKRRSYPVQGGSPQKRGVCTTPTRAASPGSTGRRNTGLRG